MKHVLVVDDSPVVRKIVRRIVEGMEMRISEAEGCEQALKMCMDEMPDAIIVDGSLGGMKPLDFVRQIRHKAAGDGPRIIYCSTENDVVFIAASKCSGADMFMLKPFTRSDLASRIEDLAA